MITVRRGLPALALAAAGLTALAATAPAAAQTPQLGRAPIGSSLVQAGPVNPAARANLARNVAALRKVARVTMSGGRVTRTGPNPALALVPEDSKLDRRGWAQTARTVAAQRATTRKSATTATGTPVATKRIGATETEPAGVRGLNDTAATAQKLPLGTSSQSYPGVDLTGRLSADPLPAPEPIAPNTEDDSTPETAGVTGVSDVRGAVSTTGFIGDALPDAEGNIPEDLDLYALDLQAGQLVSAPLRTVSGNLMPLVFLADQDGQILADTFFDPDLYNPTLVGSAPRAGRYYVGLFGFFVGSDEFTGPTTGDYALQIGARDGDTDTYRLDLAAGDVVGVSLSVPFGRVTMTDAAGTVLMGSTQDASFIYPAASPLPGGGSALVDLVAPVAGTYYVSFSGADGAYTATLEDYRPGGSRPIQQTIFLDLNGQRLNTGIFGGRGVTTLSPLDAFLPAWGLTAADRPALVKALVAQVERAVKADLIASGLSKRVAVKVVTSDEVKDPFGTAGVTRVIVGGTIQESGVWTIGIAQSIDPGNFAREESALVLLDSLSEPGDPDLAPYSINTYLTDASRRVPFIAQAVGNVVAHEIGHTIGNWHTDNANAMANLMDAGGNFALMFGVGPDGIGGTADDATVRFGKDDFSPWEGFQGIEDTLARSTWGLTR